ncbi:MAG: hypothetical protein OEY78_02285 [Gammaproteobacteria bacterium]|nr:hypothetical protein [Gammaproteobacteria bacterium]
MLQNKYEMPLDLKIKESKLINFYMVMVFVLAAVSIFISSLNLILQLVFLTSLIIVTVLFFKKHQYNNITRLLLSNDNNWKIEVNNKVLLNVELDGECIVTYYLTWLNFKVSNDFGRKKLFHLLLMPDSLDKDELRQLRVRLRLLDNLGKNGVDEVV